MDTREKVSNAGTKVMLKELADQELGHKKILEKIVTNKKYEELGKDVQFRGLTILPLNPGLLVHNTKEGKPATSVFTPLFARPKLSDMRASLSWTRQGG
jgi:rubrerythrin